MEISNNSLVKIHYKGTLEDGSVFDSSEGQEPLKFIFGVGMIIPGLEEGILGLKVGDKKVIKIESNKAYGPYMEQAVQEVPKEHFPENIDLKVGLQLAANGPNGQMPITIKEIKDSSVIVDFNHALAGKDLTFDVEVIEVSQASEEDKKEILGPMYNNNAGGCQDSNCSSCPSSCSGSDSLEDSLDENSKEDLGEDKK